MMMNDILGRKVTNGDYLIQDAEEVAYFWQCKDDRPVLIARWGIGLLEKYDMKEIRKTRKTFDDNELSVPKSVRESYIEFAVKMEFQEFKNMELIEKDSFLIKAMKLLDILPEGYFAAEPVMDEHSNMVGINIELYNERNLSEI